MNLLKYLKTKAQRFLFWLSFIAISLFLPFRTAKAIPGLDILTAPFVFLARLATALVIAIPLSWGFLALAQIFLNWASNPALVGGITTNDFVMEGWGIIRDFSNLFFILIVVAIGIATALRIKQYEVKKTLPRLIVVAILINFSPVICGVLIDVSNILMSYFMTAGAAGFGDALNLAGSAGSFLGDSVRSALGNWSEIWRGVLFVKLIFLIGFNFFAAFILALLGVLFIVRNLFLWILVILSPLAFISAVLPSTKKIIFNWWSKNFLQWTFIGVGASFFIYLSQLMLYLGTKTLMGGNVPATAVTEFGGRTITNIMVLAVPFIFLVIGYFVTLQFAPMGANAVIGAVKKGGKKIYGGAKDKGIQSLRSEARKMGEKTYDRSIGKIIRRGGTLQESKDKRKAKWEQAGGLKKAGKAMSRGVISYRLRERMRTTVDAKTQESSLTSIDKTKQEADKFKSPQSRRRGYNKAKTREEKLAYMQSAIEHHEIENYSDQEIQESIEEAATINKKLAKKIAETAPGVAQKMYDGYGDIDKEYIAATMSGDKKKSDKLYKQRSEKQTTLESQGLWMSEEDKEQHGTLEAKIIQNTKTKDIGQYKKDYVNTEQFMNIIQDNEHDGRNAWGGNALGKMAEEYGSKSVNLYNQTSETMKTMNKWFKEKHPTRKWIDSSPGAAAAGYRMPTGGGGKSTDHGSNGPILGRNGPILSGKTILTKRRPSKNKTGETITAEEIETDLGKINISKRAKKQEEKFDRKKGEDIRAD